MVMPCWSNFCMEFGDITDVTALAKNPLDCVPILVSGFNLKGCPCCHWIISSIGLIVEINELQPLFTVHQLITHILLTNRGSRFHFDSREMDCPSDPSGLKQLVSFQLEPLSATTQSDPKSAKQQLGDNLRLAARGFAGRGLTRTGHASWVQQNGPEWIFGLQVMRWISWIWDIYIYLNTDKEMWHIYCTGMEINIKHIELIERYW